MRAKALQVVAWVKRLIRVLRDVPRAVARWLRSHASHCVASVWLSGMVVFGATTTRRVLAAQLPEETAGAAEHKIEAVEVVEMLDVDEINGIRDRRMHALGLAAADGKLPDEKTIEEARAAQARGIELDGEKVATAGNIVVVTRGGIAGWLKRNRGKKPDPETLAWLRGEEAAEGRESYAGWADREDGSILSWAKEKRRALRTGTDAGSAAVPEEVAALAATAGSTDAHTGSGDPARGSGAAPTGSNGPAQTADTAPRANGSTDLAQTADTAPRANGSNDPAQTADTAPRANGSNDPAQAADTSDRIATRAVDTAQGAAVIAAGSADPARVESRHPVPSGTTATRPASVAVQGFQLASLGGAAASALAPQAPVDPPASQLAALRERMQSISTGAIAVSLRDHRVLLTLLCDQLFEHDRPELTERGAQVVRGLSRVLAVDHGHAYNVAVDPERAFELLSNLAIAGLPPERVDLALRKRDSAIDVVEVEWIDVKEAR